MLKLAALGPAGTFSELAVKKYKEQTNEDVEVIFYPTITKAVNAIGHECDIGVVPIENTLDGYVQVTLDLLVNCNLNIVSEFVIPIQFAFVANSDMKELEKIYAQFKTQGQCCKFLESLEGVKIITTESNGESTANVKKGIYAEGAIIPSHMLSSIKNPKFKIDCVTDSKENETRFIVLSKDKSSYKKEKKYKTSMVIMDAADDKPGILSKVLNDFASKGINLTSIISRPTKRGLGKYYFFIDIDGRYPENENVREVIEKIRENSIVKIIGSYYSL